MKKCSFFLFCVGVIALLSVSVGSAVTLSVDSGSGKLGTSHHQISIRLQNDVPVGGIQLKMADIPDFLTPDSVITTERSSNFTPFYSDTLGFLTIFLLSMNRSSIEPGEGGVMQIYYSIPESAREETVSISIFQENLIVVDSENNRLPVTIENGTFVITDVVQSSGHAPDCYALEQNYPNPFNPTTRIPYHLAHAGFVRLEIFNALGQSIALLDDEFRAAGSYSAVWNGRDKVGRMVPGGVYFYRLQTADFQATRTLLLLK